MFIGRVPVGRRGRGRAAARTTAVRWRASLSVRGKRGQREQRKSQLLAAVGVQGALPSRGAHYRKLVEVNGQNHDPLHLRPFEGVEGRSYLEVDEAGAIRWQTFN